VGKEACIAANPYSYGRQYINFDHIVCTGGIAGKDSCNGTRVSVSLFLCLFLLLCLSLSVSLCISVLRVSNNAFIAITLSALVVLLAKIRVWGGYDQ